MPADEVDAEDDDDEQHSPRNAQQHTAQFRKAADKVGTIPLDLRGDFKPLCAFFHIAHIGAHPDQARKFPMREAVGADGRVDGRQVIHQRPALRLHIFHRADDRREHLCLGGGQGRRIYDPCDRGVGGDLLLVLIFDGNDLDHVTYADPVVGGIGVDEDCFARAALCIGEGQLAHAEGDAEVFALRIPDKTAGIKALRVVVDIVHRLFLHL